MSKPSATSNSARQAIIFVATTSSAMKDNGSQCQRQWASNHHLSLADDPSLTHCNFAMGVGESTLYESGRVPNGEGLAIAERICADDQADAKRDAPLYNGATQVSWKRIGSTTSSSLSMRFPITAACPQKRGSSKASCVGMPTATRCTCRQSRNS